MHARREEKGPKPTAISPICTANEVESVRVCMCILPSRVSQLAFISYNMSAYHAMQTLCIPSPRDATLTQLQYWYACLPFFCTFTRTHARSHTLTCTWHSFQLSGHSSFALYLHILQLKCSAVFHTISIGKTSWSESIETYMTRTASIALIWNTYPNFQHYLQNFSGFEPKSNKMKYYWCCD